jgi:hypothetical protein
MCDKAKVVRLHTMEVLGGTGSIALTHSIPRHKMGVSGQHHGPVPIGQDAGWAPELVWIQRLEENFFCLCRGSKLDHLVVQ